MPRPGPAVGRGGSAHEGGPARRVRRSVSGIGPAGGNVAAPPQSAPPTGFTIGHGDVVKRKNPPAPLPYRPPLSKPSILRGSGPDPLGPGKREASSGFSETAQLNAVRVQGKGQMNTAPAVRKQGAVRDSRVVAPAQPATEQLPAPNAAPAVVRISDQAAANVAHVVRARANFAAIEPGDLAFSKGDLIVVTNTHGLGTAGIAGWWTGYRQLDPSVVGDFPSNYMETQAIVRHPAPEIAPAKQLPHPEPEVSGAHTTAPEVGAGLRLRLEPEPEPEPDSEPEPEPESKLEQGLVSVPMHGAGSTDGVNPGVLWNIPRVPLAEMSDGEFCGGFAERYELRVGPNYKKTGRKEPSGPALYEFVGGTLLHSATRLDNLLGSMPELIPPGHRAGQPAPPAGSAVPEYVVLNSQIPCGEAFTFNKPVDGETMNLVLLWRVSTHVVENIKSGVLSPAVGLLEEYCKKAPKIKGPKAGFRGRAKLIVKADPLPASMPSMLHGYNGKPALLTASSDVSAGTAPGEAGGNSYMEIDCNIRHWNLVARKAIASLWDTVSDLGLEIGICIEPTEDEEMPEQILGCAQVKRLSWDAAIEHNV